MGVASTSGLRALRPTACLCPVSLLLARWEHPRIRLLLLRRQLQLLCFSSLQRHHLQGVQHSPRDAPGALKPGEQSAGWAACRQTLGAVAGRSTAHLCQLKRGGAGPQGPCGTLTARPCSSHVGRRPRAPTLEGLQVEGQSGPEPGRFHLWTRKPCVRSPEGAGSFSVCLPSRLG